MNTAKQNSVEIKNLTKTFGNTVAVKNLSLDIKNGEFISLLGPSGCGKTTLLRCISGLTGPDRGKILIDGTDMTYIPASRRPVNMVFQSYSLFPHLNVFDNIAFGPRIKKWPESDIKEKVKKMLALVNLKGFEERSPNQLSGGQKQRIAVARALINQPKVLLFDEPLGALDLQIRKQLQLELRAIHQELGNTFIYVTHDQEEALVMSDRIVVMKDGEICQLGRPSEIYNNPRNIFTASFIGESNLFQIDEVYKKGNSLVLKFGKNIISVDGKSGLKGYKKVFALIRPENIEILDSKSKKELDNIFNARVDSYIFLGSNIKYELKDDSGYRINIIKNFKKNSKIFKTGEEVLIGWDSEDMIFIKE